MLFHCVTKTKIENWIQIEMWKLEHIELTNLKMENWKSNMLIVQIQFLKMENLNWNAYCANSVFVKYWKARYTLK